MAQVIDKRAIPSSLLPNHAVGSLPDFASLCRSTPRSVSLHNTYVTPSSDAPLVCARGRSQVPQWPGTGHSVGPVTRTGGVPGVGPGPSLTMSPSREDSASTVLPPDSPTTLPVCNFDNLEAVGCSCFVAFLRLVDTQYCTFLHNPVGFFYAFHFPATCVMLLMIA